MPRARTDIRSLCTTFGAAKLLGVTPRTVQIWADGGILVSWKTKGGHRRITRDSIDRILAEGLPGHGNDSAGGNRGAPAPLRVLVVEDDPTFQRLYRLKLATWSLQPVVATVGNGFEALVRIGIERPDILIADLMMPDMDGFKLIQAIRAMPELDHMEIIVVSAMDAEDITAHGGLPSGIPVFHKPVPFQELESLVAATWARAIRDRNRSSST